VLDIACGTGRSFVPLLGRGYAVVACDSSGEMLRRAARKAPQTPVLVADVRTLPELGRYDLVTCLGGALNCLLHPHDVRAALRAVARSLVRAGRRGGLGGPPARADPRVVRERLGRRSRRVVHRLARDGLARDRPGRGRRGARERLPSPCRARGSAPRRGLTHRHWPVAEIHRHARESGLAVLEVDDALFVARKA